MLYLDVAMPCFDSATCCLDGISSATMLVHKIFGSHPLFGMTVVSLGDVGGNTRQFLLEVPLF